MWGAPNFVFVLLVFKNKRIVYDIKHRNRKGRNVHEDSIA